MPGERHVLAAEQLERGEVRETTSRLVEQSDDERFETRSLGPVELRGISRPLEVHEVIGTTTTPAKVEVLLEVFDDVRVLKGSDSEAIREAIVAEAATYGQKIRDELAAKNPAVLVLDQHPEYWTRDMYWALKRWVFDQK